MINHLIKFQLKTKSNTHTHTHRYACKIGIVQLDLNCILYVQENFIISLTIKMLNTYSKA